MNLKQLKAKRKKDLMRAKMGKTKSKKSKSMKELTLENKKLARTKELMLENIELEKKINGLVEESEADDFGRIKGDDVYQSKMFGNKMVKLDKMGNIETWSGDNSLVNYGNIRVRDIEDVIEGYKNRHTNLPMDATLWDESEPKAVRNWINSLIKKGLFTHLIEETVNEEVSEDDAIDSDFGYGINVGNEDLLIANAEEDGIEIDSDELTKDVLQIEDNILRLMEKDPRFSHVGINQGHDGDGELIGDIKFSPEGYEELVVNYNEPYTTTSGTLLYDDEQAIYKNTSGKYDGVIDITIDFYSYE